MFPQKNTIFLSDFQWYHEALKPWHGRNVEQSAAAAEDLSPAGGDGRGGWGDLYGYSNYSWLVVWIIFYFP